jgi:NADP-dependent 3-hydroxy acid dehydrogenase YdfG
MKDLIGKVAFITGGASGLGLVIARRRMPYTFDGFGGRFGCL